MSIPISATNSVPVESLLSTNTKKNNSTNFTEALVAKQDLQKSDIATDKVSLSNLSTTLAQADSTTSDTNSLKQYALAPWYSDYGINLSNSTYSQKQAPMSKFNQLSNDDKSYYGKQIQSIYQSVLADNGIADDANKRYNDLYLDQTASTRIHQEMTDKIKQDAKLVEIFNKIGKASVLA